MTWKLLGRSFVASSPFLLAFSVALGLYVPLSIEITFFVALAVAALGTVASLPLLDRPTPVPRLLAICAAGLLGGALSANLAADVPFVPPAVADESPGNSRGRTVAVSGRARGDAVETASGLYRLPVELESVGVPVFAGGGRGSQSWPGKGTLLFRRVPGSERTVGASPLLWGDRFSAVGNLWCPDPGDACIFVAEDLLPEVASGDSAGAGLWDRLLAVRRGARKSIGVSLARLPGDIRPLTGALVLGDRGFLRSGVVEQFRGAGLSHVLALSGMHLGVVAGSAMLLTRRVFGKRGGAIAGMVVAWGYIFIVGPGASLLRAAVMFTIWGLLRLWGRQSSALNVLGYSFVALVVLWPGATREIGFSFSFLALAGLLLVGVPLGRLLEGWFPPGWASALGASLGAFLATAPLSLFLFGFAAPIGILGSVLVAPVVVVVLWSGMVLLAGSLLQSLVLPALWVGRVSQALLLSVVDWSARVPDFSVASGSPGSWLLGVLPLVAVALGYWLRLSRVGLRRRRLEKELLLV